MRRAKTRLSCLVCAGVLLIAVVASPAHAATIVLQLPDASGIGRAAQTFPDLPTFSSYEFDDFSTASAYLLTSLTVYGVELGTSSANLAVTAEIWNGLPGSGSIVLSTLGAEVGNDLQFNFGGALLPAGSYWLTSYVTRPFSGGGQWFWLTSQPVTGSQSYFYNPGGGFGQGTSPIPGSRQFLIAANQAFQLEGDLAPTAVPEPTSFTLLGVGLVGRWAWRRRPRNQSRPTHDLVA